MPDCRTGVVRMRVTLFLTARGGGAEGGGSNYLLYVPLLKPVSQIPYVPLYGLS